jgi:prolyl-tRNA synthetase
MKKLENLGEWYDKALLDAEMVDFSPIKGFIIYRPYFYRMWEIFAANLDAKFKEKGVENCYFPLLIPESVLSKESEHIEGFKPEVAWVTEAGDSKLPERYAIRPTSETIMYNSYAKWIKSYKDLPIRYNQWNNVVRWETKETRFLLRGREFLWQEGHSVFRSAEEADKDAYEMLKIYRNVVEDLLAVPVFEGIKSEKEKFAGAVKTYTIELIVDDGKAIQMATSHFLGQNFSKAFGIEFLNENNEREFAYQNSWGISVRALGASMLFHGDDKGLILPPKIAPIQFIIIPIYTGEKKDEEIEAFAIDIYNKLNGMGLRAKIDLERDKTPGWKYNYYEIKGVPFRIDIGEKEVSTKTLFIKRRFDGKTFHFKLEEIEKLKELIIETHNLMYEKGKEKINSLLKETYNKDEAISLLQNGRPIITSWCGEPACEEEIKNKTAATSRLIFLDKKPTSDVCTFCGRKAKYQALFAKSY